MLIVRDIFVAKPGQASKLAKLFKKSMGNMLNLRVMTDLVGDYNTVVMEMQLNSLSDWEKVKEQYKNGNVNPTLDPKVAEEMSHYTEMYTTGKREIFQIVD